MRAEARGTFALEQYLEREQAGFDERGMKGEAKAVLEADHAEGGRLERDVFLLARMRSVVGCDRLDRAVDERCEQHRAIVLGPQRRVHLQVRVERA